MKGYESMGFIIVLFIGGTVGVFSMALVSANRFTEQQALNSQLIEENNKLKGEIAND